MKRLHQLGAFAAALVLLVAVMPRPSEAGSLSSTYLRLDRMKAATATSMRLVFTTATLSASGGKVMVTMPAGFTVNTTQTVDNSTCAAATGATALTSSSTFTVAGDNTLKTITLSNVAALTAATKYCIDFNSASAVTNATAGGYTATIATQTSGGTSIDTTSVALRIISDDQISITAVVPPTFNFVLSGNSDAFSSNLDSSSVVSTGGKTVTITTNASKGWIAWVKDANQGLTSVTAGGTIATLGTVNGAPNTLSSGSEGYVLDVDLTADASGGGTVVIDPEYNGTSTSSGGTLSSILQPIASSNGTSTGDVLTLIARASISPATAAANDYSDTLTVIGAGNY